MTEVAEIKAILPDVKTVIDTAREIKAGGETAHQVIGEISISLERLLGLNKKRTIDRKDNEGRITETETVEPLFDECYIKGELINKFFEKTDRYLKMIYDNQREERKCRYSFWGFVILLVALIVILFQANLPVSK